MGDPGKELLTSGLKDVSRSFYLTLRVLPRQIRSQIGLAYLLARTTDTIADTELLPVERRLQALEALQQRIAGHHQDALDFGEFAHQQGSPAERRLLEKTELSLSLLANVSDADRDLIRKVLEVITSGQVLDLRRFGKPAAGQIIALKTNEELDDYTYRVAGCVGEFWTKMCRRHLFPAAPLDDSQLLANGIRFGKGLQLVNILRDLVKDLRQGRCYLPEPELSIASLKPDDLLKPQNEARLRPLYYRYLDTAESHLRAGWQYTNTLPWKFVRVRLACAWPILIGMETIQRLRQANILEGKVIKVTRSNVRTIILRSAIWYPAPSQWKKLVP